MGKGKLFALMGLMGALSGGREYSHANRYGKEPKSIDDIVRDRKERGLKSSYVEKPVKPYHGKKKQSRKQRKNK